MPYDASSGSAFVIAPPANLCLSSLERSPACVAVSVTSAHSSESSSGMRTQVKSNGKGDALLALISTATTTTRELSTK
eukprot:scaffold52039_cov65-Phaeocystis_antarctica.AAC.2